MFLAMLFLTVMIRIWSNGTNMPVIIVASAKYMGGAFEILFYNVYFVFLLLTLQRHTYSSSVHKQTKAAKTKFNLHFILIILCTCVRICAYVYCTSSSNVLDIRCYIRVHTKDFSAKAVALHQKVCLFF